MNIPAFLNTVTNRSFTLPLVILYVTAGCNLRCIMCSYRDPLPNELSLEELKKLSDDLASLGLRHIVYSGGEPLMRRDFPSICEIFKHTGANQSLLTNGVLLKKRYQEIRQYFSEIIISIDGSTAGIHDSIRGVEMFDRIITGVREVTLSTNRPKVSIRTVIQKKNYREMGKMVRLAKTLDVDRISFLPADVLSGAFHRDYNGLLGERGEIILTEEETGEFRHLMHSFVEEFRTEIDSGFISENPDKLFHMVRYFEALTGTRSLPRNDCNAPNVSTVITSTGDVLPCFFLPSFGNIRKGGLKQLLNNTHIRTIRKDVRNYALQRCKECVCTLKINPVSALSDRF